MTKNPATRGPLDSVSKLHAALDDAEWAAASALLQWASSKRLAGKETELQKIPNIVDDEGIHWLPIARRLDEFQCGRLILGRHNRSTRISWPADLPELAKAAADLSGKGNLPQGFFDEHRLPLPNGREVFLRLPADLSAKEGEMVQAWVGLHLETRKKTSS